MATLAYMTRIHQDRYADQINNDAWEFVVSLAAPGNSDPIMIPSNIKGVSCTLSVSGGGTGSLETTMSSQASIENDTAVWVTWSKGTISVSAQDYTLPVRAIRLVNVSGATKLEMLAQ